MENSNTANIKVIYKNMNPQQHLLSLNLSSVNSIDYKTPFLYETWTWEGDESVLPYKWVEMIKLSPLALKYEISQIKDYIKENYYNNIKFDKKSFFFITHRSEVAGCVYLKTSEEDSRVYIIEYLLINTKKHSGKGVDDALVSLAVKRAYELSENKVKDIFVDLNTSNVDVKKFDL